MPFVSKERAEQLESYACSGDGVVEMFCALLQARGALMSGDQDDWFAHGDWEDRTIALMRDMKREVYRRLDKLDAVPRKGRLDGEPWDVYERAVASGKREA